MIIGRYGKVSGGGRKATIGRFGNCRRSSRVVAVADEAGYGRHCES